LALVWYVGFKRYVGNEGEKMCLAVPAEVLKIEGDEAIIDYGGVRRITNISLIENVKVGDYVLIHVGFAIQKLKMKDAVESLKLWRSLLREGDAI
jgi:hydrogenase expression/formation protein HypC